MARSHVLRIGFIEEPFFAITFFSVRQINGSPINYPTLPLPFFPFHVGKIRRTDVETNNTNEQVKLNLLT
jgi:hypothetical protein